MFVYYYHFLKIQYKTRFLFFITFWIPNCHVVNGLIWMFCLHKVDQQVSQDFSVIIVVRVQQRNLHAPVCEIGENTLMEGTVWYEHSYIRLLLNDFPANCSQLVSPALPEVWIIIVVTNPDGCVLRAHDQHHGSLHIRVGVGSAAMTTF